MRLSRFLLVLAMTLAAIAAGGSLAQSASAAVRATAHPGVPAVRHPGSTSVPLEGRSPGHPLPGSKARGANTTDSTNWSGYIAEGGSYTSVSSSWVQPAITCPTVVQPVASAPQASFWVGLDGYSPADYSVEQTGTGADCAGTSPTYFAWHELFPSPTVEYSDTVEPGDRFTGSVIYTGGGDYTYDLVDNTRGWTEEHVYYDAGLNNASAEIIAEAPSIATSSGSSVLPLADFGAVAFTNSTVNGGSLAAADAQSYAIADNGRPVAEPTAYDSSGDFTVAYYGALTSAVRYSSADLALDSNQGVRDTQEVVAANTSPSLTTTAAGAETAIQSSTGQLALWGPSGGSTPSLGMAAGTSPAIAELSNGSYIVVYQANTGYLSTYTPSAGGTRIPLGLAAGTSPAVTALSNGSYMVAFQANTGNLWTYSPSAGGTQIPLGLAAGTSPSITSQGSSYIVAYEANTDYLWTYSPSAGGTQIPLGMAPGTSPSISALPGSSSYTVAFQANTGNLWTYSPAAGAVNSGQAMASGTSPSIAAMPDGAAVAFQAGSGHLCLYGTFGTFGTFDTGDALSGHSNPSVFGYVHP